MSTKVQIRRGTTSSANAFTGAEGELYVDLDQKSLRVHDGVLQGGYQLAKASELTSKVDKINITAGTVGSGSSIPVLTYNAQGQITSVSTATLNIPSNIATETYVNTQVANLVDSSPSTLNTLNELAAALGDDPNFATTITTALGNKVNTSSLATVATSGSYNDLTSKPNFLGITSNIVPLFNSTFTLGSTSNRWSNVHATVVTTPSLNLPSNGAISINGAIGGFPNDIKTLRNNGGTLSWDKLSYNDLTDKPSIPTNISAFTNDAGYLDSTKFKTIGGQSIVGSGDLPGASSQVYYKKVSWSKSANNTNSVLSTPTTFATLSFVAAKTGQIMVDFHPSDVYWFGGNGNLGFTLEVVGNSTEEDFQFITNLGGYVSGQFAVYYRPFRVITSVTAGNNVTINFKYFLQSVPATGNYFNFPGNASSSLLTYQYISGISF